MTSNKINLGFTHYSGPNIQAKTRDIIAALSDNPSLPDPDPSIATVTATLNQFVADSVAAAAGSHAAVVNKRISRKELETLLVLLGQWIMSVAKNNPAVLATCGYTLTKKAEPRYITAPANVTLSNGISSGQLLVSFSAVKGATGYQFEISDIPPGEDTAWVSTVSSSCKFTYRNLVPGKQYWLRVAAAGGRQQLQYSEVVSRFVQ